MSDLIEKLEKLERIDKAQAIAAVKLRRHYYDEAAKFIEKANAIDRILFKNNAKAEADILIFGGERIDLVG